MSGLNRIQRHARIQKSFSFSDPLIGLPGLWMHWSADNIFGLNDGDAVIACPDWSGNGRNGVATATNMPTWKTNIVNGKPALRFNNAHSIRTAPGALNGLTAGELFLVVKYDAANDGNGNGLWWTDPTGLSAFNLPWVNNLFYEGIFLSRRIGGVASPVSFDSIFHVYNIRSGGGAYIQAIDTSVFYNSTSGETFPSFNSTHSFDLGHSSNGSNNYYITGYIPELVMCSAVLGSTDRATTMSYLKTKYALTGY